MSPAGRRTLPALQFHRRPDRGRRRAPSVYVGMTRARQRLFLTFADMRRRMGMIEGGMPSRFLNEIPERTLDAPIEPVASPGVYGGAWLATARILALAGNEYAQPEAPDSYSQEASCTGVPAPCRRMRSPAGTDHHYEVGMRIRHERFGAGDRAQGRRPAASRRASRSFSTPAANASFSCTTHPCAFIAMSNKINPRRRPSSREAGAHQALARRGRDDHGAARPHCRLCGEAAGRTPT